MTFLILVAAMAQGPAACRPAGSAVRIEGRVRGLYEVVFTVVNRRPDPIRQIRMGTSEGFVLVEKELPKIAQTPPGWTGTVVRHEATGRVDIVWNATSGAVLQAGSLAEFAIWVLSFRVMRSRENIPPAEWLLPFDYRSLAFTATAVSGACRIGASSNPAGHREGGAYSSLRGGAVRVLAQPGDDAILLDVPLRENLGRLAHGLYLTVPFAVTFGVTGGFSADMSIGIGLTWAPSPYLSASAKTSFGTFFFNNRTWTRGVGLDVAIPIERRWFAENLRRGTRYMVIGVEYFRRDVTKWAGFMEGPQWYASGSGLAIRVRGVVGAVTSRWSDESRARYTSYWPIRVPGAVPYPPKRRASLKVIFTCTFGPGVTGVGGDFASFWYMPIGVPAGGGPPIPV
jgi:hypothetical protein